MSHRINSDSNDNGEHKEPMLDTNNSDNDKIHKANKLRERKNNRSQRDTGETRNRMERSSFTK